MTMHASRQIDASPCTVPPSSPASTPCSTSRGLLVRAFVYSLLGQLAGHSDAAAMVLAGTFVGDAISSVIHVFWDEAGHTSETIAELVLLLIVFLWFGSDMTWPAIFTASAMPFWVVVVGVTALRLRRGMLKPVGLDDHSWS